MKASHVHHGAVRNPDEAAAKHMGIVGKRIENFHADAVRRPATDSPVPLPPFGGVHPGRTVMEMPFGGVHPGSTVVESSSTDEPIDAYPDQFPADPSEEWPVDIVLIPDDENSNDPNVLKAELDVLSTPHSVYYSDIVVESLQNVQEQCYVDFESVCATNPMYMASFMNNENPPVSLTNLMQKLTSFFGDVVPVDAEAESTTPSKYLNPNLIRSLNVLCFYVLQK